eukprot:215433_1
MGASVLAIVLTILVAHVMCQDDLIGELCDIGDQSINGGAGGTCPGTGTAGIDVFYYYDSASGYVTMELRANKGAWFGIGIGGETGGSPWGNNQPSMMDGTYAFISNSHGDFKETKNYILGNHSLGTAIPDGPDKWVEDSVTVIDSDVSHIVTREATHGAGSWDLPSTVGTYGIIVARSDIGPDFWDAEAPGDPAHDISVATTIDIDTFTFDPTTEPTVEPTLEPSFEPTMEPTTDEPTTAEPSHQPTTAEPTYQPTDQPTQQPTTVEPSDQPTTAEPTTAEPTTAEPTTAEPSDQPTTAEP